MKTQILAASLALSTLIAAPATYAETTGRLKIDISDIAKGISLEIQGSDLGLDKLLDARDQLSSVMSAIRPVIVSPVEAPIDISVVPEAEEPYDLGGVEPREACLDFAFKQYNKTYSADTAMTEAMTACRRITELEIAKFIFAKAYLTYTAAGAMDVAARYANRDLRGKADLLEFMYDGYAQTLSSGTAIATAAEKSAEMEAYGLRCLRYSYARRARSVSSAAAMNRAVEDCR